MTGAGRSRGVDLFVKGPVALGISGRVSYSLLSAERTDPHTRTMTRAPFDVTHTLAAIAGLPRLASLGLPILCGPSRKSFLKVSVGDLPPQSRGALGEMTPEMAKAVKAYLMDELKR